MRRNLADKRKPFGANPIVGFDLCPRSLDRLAVDGVEPAKSTAE